MKIFAKRILALGICTALMGASVQAATYEVIDKGAVDTHKYTFAQQENIHGEMVISGTQAYSFAVQYQYLVESDFNAIVNNAAVLNDQVFGVNDIEDEEALRAGNPTENDVFWVLYYLQRIPAANQFLYQQYGDIAALINLNGVTEEITIFDEMFEGTNEFTRSTVDNINGITDKGWIYGSGTAPYLPVVITADQNTEDTSDDVSTNYWVREFSRRAFFSPDRGQTIIPLIAPESTYGGISEISDLSESGIAIGFASTVISEQVTDFITESCTDADQLENIPLIVCIDVTLRNNGLTLDNLFQTEAFKWTINDSGVVESSEQLGYLITPHVDDVRGLVSVAQAVNDAGTVVGYSQGWFDNNVTEPDVNEFKLTYAVMFKDGEVYDLNTDHETFYNSRVNDINNLGIATGYVQTTVSGITTNMFYYIDTNDVNNLEMIMPDTFFTGSSTTAKAINNKGFIVGQGEVETHVVTGGNPRRTHGFLYDTNTDTFTDLNAFLTCESDYTIIDAKSINDNNEISASALVKTNAKDFFGRDVLDDNGDPVQEEVVRAVKLQPIEGGELNDCSEVEEKLERQGASFGVFMPLVLLVVGFRRKLFK
ncbi:DUF3466 family protein [Pseudocolwellia agarivorans]|uniref:DUF3466 family protein n=1 Tax=Pseudocolwellia agarivorans TaxID=1911682 RepID=UPI000985F14B|nr:DUF3466 family protein [Pseudocolwellia agarivorans]